VSGKEEKEKVEIRKIPGKADTLKTATLKVESAKKVEG
jgi:hypothetical protein